MAAPNICSKCLRQALRSSLPTRVPRRTFAASASKTPSTGRRLHQASRQRAAAIEPQRSTVNDPPPETLARGQQANKDAPQRQSPRALLRPNNLFHSYTRSPSPEIRQRAAFIRQNAYCPHPDHQPTRQPTSPFDPEGRKTVEAGGAQQAPRHVSHECPDCGIPVSCCEEHFVDDYGSHLEICDLLRQINEDDHDLVSGRFFPEFEYPGVQIDEAQVNLTNWDTSLQSRVPCRERGPADEAGDETAHISDHALRYTLHPPRSGAGIDVKGIRPNPPPMRLFVLGARAESSLPREVWLQLAHLFPRATFHVILIGPEAMANRDNEFPLPERTPANPFGAIVEDRLGGQMKISTYVEYFHTLHAAQHFYPYDPYFDCFVLFHPGLGHPASSHEWTETLPQLLETKVPVLCTGYTEFDMERDIAWVKEQAKGEADLLMQAGENRFRSLRWDLNDADPGDVSCGNWGVWAFRGKRYEADEYRGKREDGEGSGGWDK
ncbi:translational activator for mitochondrial COX1 [Friedmanniomyces endolithicus]|nr:translational activator for mitochondrial COX1 [Friedmanniomyces endolithicus]